MEHLNASAGSHDLAGLEVQAIAASRAGREEEAVRHWQRILEIDARHARSLEALGQRAFRRGDLASAHAHYTRLVEADGRDTQQWVNLAVVCQGLRDDAGEEAAIKGALNRDPLDLLALILRANLLERQGRRDEAAHAHGIVTRVSPPLEQLHPDLRPAVSHAIQFCDQYHAEVAQFLDATFEPLYAEFKGEKSIQRFRDSVDAMVGRKRRFESQPAIFHYPHLPAIEFFDRDEFPWLDAIEAETNAIRDEFLEVLSAEQGFTPYITYPQGVPLNQWAELNNSPDWSAFHLKKSGAAVPENAAKCPRTLAALAHAPQPDQQARTPTAMFSLLKPRKHIPAHTGVTNVRLVTHLPLIIPEGCRFRVGNETRPWIPGKAWVFDDTIEHEAWNDSDKLRVVLIFDIWHPHLTLVERTCITRLAASMTTFAGGVTPGFDP
jgi:aspartyl/asparaginyl beta-hydroxylase (cupin superfamily)